MLTGIQCPKGFIIKAGSGWTEGRKGYVKEMEFLCGYIINRNIIKEFTAARGWMSSEREILVLKVDSIILKSKCYYF